MVFLFMNAEYARRAKKREGDAKLDMAYFCGTVSTRK